MASKGQQVRGRILDAANRLFYERGFNRTSFTDIADAADIPRGNFYYYFRSKDQILGAVIDARLDDISSMLKRWSSTIDDPRDRLKRYLKIAVNEAPEVVLHGCPMGSLNQELIKDQTVLREQARKMFDLFGGWLEEQFGALGNSKDAASDLARHLQARMQGIALLGAVYNDTEFITREVRQLVRWLEEL
jgi:TetR/AcrR family transcriptional regulator, transcriptional repressor for nem operon